MALAVKQNVPDSIYIGLLCANTVVPEANLRPHLIEQLGWMIFRISNL